MKSSVLHFDRPNNLQATETPEDRLIERDEVRLLVTTPDDNSHAVFKDLPSYLRAGDVIVVNESETIRASLPAEGSVGEFVLNLSTDYGNGLWLVEPRWSTDTPA